MSTPAKITPESQVYITAHVHASKHRPELEASEIPEVFGFFHRVAHRPARASALAQLSRTR